jgi:hypothetical protein
LLHVSLTSFRNARESSNSTSGCNSSRGFIKVICATKGANLTLKVTTLTNFHKSSWWLNANKKTTVKSRHLLQIPVLHNTMSSSRCKNRLCRAKYVVIACDKLTIMCYSRHLVLIGMVCSQNGCEKQKFSYELNYLKIFTFFLKIIK